jgi:hypothetical protein
MWSTGLPPEIGSLYAKDVADNWDHYDSIPGKSAIRSIGSCIATVRVVLSWRDD